MQKILSTLFLGIFILSNTQTQAQAQDFKIRGKIVDAVSRIPLESATIYAESIKDSALVAYTISNAQGFFDLQGKSSLKKLNLFFSYNGYKVLPMQIDVKKNIDLKVVQMEEQVEELKSVNVIGERIPVRVKQDTLEFNADSFKARPDATVEDMLKKLPGVEVDTEGKITVNGKEVNQVLVNGQVFFSDDPKIATKSLPKEIISKIQILDTKTKTQEFTGEAGDGESKTINLTIKEDKNKGYLGRFSAGYGTDERYQANGLLNYFNGKERISLIAGSNNVNNAGFSFDEIYDMVGRGSGRGISVSSQGGFSVGNLSFGFGEGIITSSNIGASYANQKKGEYEANANFFFANSDSFNDEKTVRENILPTGRFFTNTESGFTGLTNSNQGSANLTFDVDKTLRITLVPSLSVNRTDSKNLRNTWSTNELGETINTNNTRNTSDGVQRNFSNRLAVIKRLDTLGSYLRLSLENDNNDANTLDNLKSERVVFGSNASEEVLDQETVVDNRTDRYQLNLRYRKALNKELHLDFGYELDTRTENNNRSVFDFDVDSNSYSGFNTTLSSDFKFRNTAHIPYIGIRNQTQKYRWGIIGRYRRTNLRNTDFLQSADFSKNYENFLLSVYGNYTISQNKRISIQYRTNFNAPNVNELQPVSNVSDPLNVRIGNPNLRPGIRRNIYINYNDYNWRQRTGLFVHMRLTFQDDQVVSNTTTDEGFLRTTRYVNVDGNYDYNGGIGYSKELKKDSTLTVKLNIRPNLNIQKNVSFTNGERLEAKRLSAIPRVGVLFNFKELVTLEPEYSLSLNTTKYNLERFSNINFTSHSTKFKTTTYWPKNLVWENDINYNYNGNVGPGFDKDAIFWNMSLGMQMMQKKATVKVLAYDLLNQNINTRRTTGQDFIQDFQGTVLQRYLMMSFTYKFDQFGGKRPGNNQR
ncbi:outer membrane beta-barrel protein [Maribacter sp. 2304DJ31-5]|uniref:outer membrane beta-barrel protein n=1 Tax=Maribacter sp. 2304DJ31-5 TaxID=3386273 RepID=UPI0039BC45E8